MLANVLDLPALCANDYLHTDLRQASEFRSVQSHVNAGNVLLSVIHWPVTSFDQLYAGHRQSASKWKMVAGEFKPGMTCPHSLHTSRALLHSCRQQFKPSPVQKLRVTLRLFVAFAQVWTMRLQVSGCAR